MKFTKMQGAGNDFIIIENFQNYILGSEFSSIAKKLCDRKFGIGADGLMFIEKSNNPDADYRMLFYNSDGSIGEMCGNGARCICRYGYDHQLCSGVNQVVETTAGIVTGERINANTYKVRLNDPKDISLNIDVSVLDKHYSVDYMVLGVPHCVLLVSDAMSLDKDSNFKLCKELRNYKGFKSGANVDLVKILDFHHVKAITYERGVEDYTLACGTGCGAIVTALALRGDVSYEDVTVSMPGGDLKVTVVSDAQNITDVYLTGPAEIICTGESY